VGAPRIADGFSLVAGGDWIMPFPIAPLSATDPGVASVAATFRGATLAMVNLETNLLDPATDGVSPRVVDDWCLTAQPQVAGDLRELGVGLVSRANNHAMDWGTAGMRATGARLDAAGIAHAGTGPTASAARAPVYVTTSHGRVALIAIYPTRTFDPDAAIDAFGTVPAKPGVHALRLRRTIALAAADLDAVTRIAAAIDPDGQVAAGDDPIALDDTRFEAATGQAPSVRYAPDPDDLAATVRSVRLASQHADLVVVSVHAHQEGPDVATPPAYLQDLARACIDAGADLFHGHGVHRLWPVELYRGRTICYGVGNAAFSDIQEPLHEAMARFAAPRLPAGIDPTDATDADLNAAALGPYFDDDRYYEGVLVRLAVDGGAWRTSLIPLDLRRGDGLTRRGIPRPAEPEHAAAMCKRLSEMSAPFGTTLDETGEVTAR
jgi:poly-gamma-glutamate synthesis protein (capsule biosynthesis protein)